MEIIQDKRSLEFLRKLSDLWDRRQSFVLIPEKSPFRLDFLEDAIRTIPNSYSRDHFVLATSGTTGEPKLIIASMSRAEKLVHTLHGLQGNAGCEEAIASLPLSYSFSFVNQWLWSKIYSKPIRYVEGLSSPQEYLSVLEAANDSMLCMVGIQAPLLLDYAMGRSFPGVRRIHFAGGRFPQAHLSALEEMFPNASIYNNYGCAEAMPRLTLRKAVESSVSTNVGYPIDGVTLKCSDDGALLFRSPYRAVGVVEGRVFSQIDDIEWLPTGDVGCLNEEGECILSGRRSDVFKRHGEKISLLVITEFLSPVIKEGRFILYREVDLQNEEGFCIVLESGCTDGQKMDILRAFRKNFKRAHWPIRIERIDQIPMLPNGKPDLVEIKKATGKEMIWNQPHL